MNMMLLPDPSNSYPNLFLRHYAAKTVACRDLPVMAILKEFRQMAGPKGRKDHRLFPPAKYEYEAKRQEEGSSSQLKSSNDSLPPVEED